MKPQPRWSMLLIFLITLAVGLSSMPVAFTAPASDSYRVLLPLVLTPASDSLTENYNLVGYEISEEDQATSETLWTRENLLAAVQLEMPAIEDAGELAELTEELEALAGPTEIFDGMLPDDDSLALAKTFYSDQWAAIAADEQLAMDSEGAELAAAAFTRWTVSSSQWQTYPHRAIGRLFFTTPSGSRNWCTASVAVGRAVWTAGHCVFTPGRGWHRNFLFIPAYRNGFAPFGRFVGLNVTALTGWTRGGSNANAYDIAMMSVRDNNGRRVSQWVGYLGAMWNASRTQTFNTFGYPGNILRGEYLIGCRGRTYRIDRLFNPPTTGMGCDMAGGSSGGPWLVSYAVNRSGAVNYVNGVVSYGRPSVWRNEFFTPYFGDGARNLYNWGRLR